MHTRINTLEELAHAAEQKRSVFTHFCKQMPAAFLINMPGCIILRWLQIGLYLYPKKWRQPRALLTAGFPPGTSWIIKSPDGNTTGCDILSVEGDMAYVAVRMGTGFVPTRLLVRELKFHYHPNNNSTPYPNEHKHRSRYTRRS